MIHTLKVTITVYVFAMFCYAVWYPLQVIDLANMNPDREWLGSLCYLPHGARVLMFCFFRYYSIPGLYLAEISILAPPITVMGATLSIRTNLFLISLKGYANLFLSKLTMIETRDLTSVLASQPNCFFAFSDEPIRMSTSAGR